MPVTNLFVSQTIIHCASFTHTLAPEHFMKICCIEVVCCVVLNNNIRLVLNITILYTNIVLRTYMITTAILQTIQTEYRHIARSSKQYTYFEVVCCCYAKCI